MSVGLTNAPVVFMDLMNKILTSNLNMFVVVFIHDTLLYALKEESHKEHLRIVLQTLKEHKL